MKVDTNKPISLYIEDKKIVVTNSESPLISQNDFYKKVQKNIFEDIDCMWSKSDYDSGKDENGNFQRIMLKNDDVKNTLYHRFENSGTEDFDEEIESKDTDIYDVTDESKRGLVVKYSEKVIPHIFDELNNLGILSLEHVSSCGTCSHHIRHLSLRKELLNVLPKDVLIKKPIVIPHLSFHSQGFMDSWFRHLSLPVSWGHTSSFDIKRGDVKKGTKTTYDGKEEYPLDDEISNKEVLNEVIDNVFTKYGFTTNNDSFGYNTTFENLEKQYHKIIDNDVNDFLSDIFSDKELQSLSMVGLN